VTTPQEISLADVRKSISFCHTVNMNIVGIIENMSGFMCPHCGNAVELFGMGGGEKTALNENIPFLGRVPFDPKLAACGDDGVSFLEKYKESAAAAAFIQLARAVTHKNMPPVRSKGNTVKKFAVPVSEGKLTEHFGHCREFAIVEADENSILKKEILVPPPHEPGVLPEWLGKMGTDVVIAGGMGQRAAELFTQAGITVVTGAPSQSPESLVMSYLNNALTSTQNYCEGGDHSHCHH
jgi:predicted Fe-Mo cluster-binding NifX family protein